MLFWQFAKVKLMFFRVKGRVHMWTKVPLDGSPSHRRTLWTLVGSLLKGTSGTLAGLLLLVPQQAMLRPFIGNWFLKPLTCCIIEEAYGYLLENVWYKRCCNVQIQRGGVLGYTSRYLKVIWPLSEFIGAERLFSLLNMSTAGPIFTL